MSMELLDKSGLAYFWTKLKAYFAPNVVSSASRSADIAANGTFTVPSYTVGKQQLLVYLDGCLSRQGDGWSEVGTAGTASTTIKFLQLIPKAMEIVVRVN